MASTGIVKKLDNDTVSYVKATTVIGSVSRIVEELVFNSLDANSSFIQIAIDFESLSVEVCDDGSGMQKELLQRQQEHSWNLTTKGFSNSCDTGNFGCKGEAIAAISTICDVSIATRPSGTAEGFSMVVSPRAAAVRQVSSAAGNQVTPPAVITAANRAFSGTTVVVTNIFHNIPVRRASIRKQQEVQAVENFIRQVSLLFHEVEFAVLDRGSSSSGSEGRYFIHYSPVESVASRLTAAHGEVTLSKMTEVREEMGGYALVGLITPPKREFLHWNKSMQYCYVNKRYCSSSVSNFSFKSAGKSPVFDSCDNLLKTVINRLFYDHLQVSTSSSGLVVGAASINQSCGSPTDQRSLTGPHIANGPTAKHYDVKHQKYNLFPCFVLQLHCPEDAYDVLYEPSKSAILFKQPAEVIQIVRRLFKKLVHSMNTHDNLKSGTNARQSAAASEVGVANYRDNDNMHDSAADTDDNGGVATASRSGKRTAKPFESFSYSPKDTEESPACDARRKRVCVAPVLSSAMGASAGMSSLSPASRLMACTYFASPKEKLLMKNYTSVEPVGGPRASVTNLEGGSSLVEDIRGGEDGGEMEGISLLSEFGVSVQRRGAILAAGVTAAASATIASDRVSINTSAASTASVADLVAYYDSLCDESPGRNTRNISSSDGNTAFLVTGSPGPRAGPRGEDTGIAGLQGNSPGGISVCSWDVDGVGVQSPCPSTASAEDPGPKHSSGDSSPPPSSPASSRSSRHFSPSKRPTSYIPFGSGSIEWENEVPRASHLRHLRSLSANSKVSVSSGRVHSAAQLFGRVASRGRSVGGEVALKLNREMLQNCKVVGQFDCKYILILCPLASNDTEADDLSQTELLVCVDQHAADERVRYDAAYRCVHGSAQCSARSTPTALPIQTTREPLDLTQSERNSLDYFFLDLSAWGFSWESGGPTVAASTGMDDKSGSGTAPRPHRADGVGLENGNLHLTQVPVVQGEPLTPSDFLEFLQLLSQPNSGAAGHTQSLMCGPPAVHRILCSQSCRSAIMFNTALTGEQCTNLVFKLGSPTHTQFPFQCAHGRPAVIPLTEMQFE